MKTTFAILAIAAAVGLSGTSALAGGYIKYGDIKGETTKARVNVAAGDVNNDGRAARAHGRVRGGLNPADTVKAPQPEQRMLLPAVQKVRPGQERQAQKGHARVRGGLNPADTVQAPRKDETGLLLPAVQNAH